MIKIDRATKKFAFALVRKNHITTFEDHFQKRRTG